MALPILSIMMYSNNALYSKGYLDQGPLMKVPTVEEFEAARQTPASKRWNILWPAALTILLTFALVAAVRRATNKTK